MKETTGRIRRLETNGGVFMKKRYLVLEDGTVFEGRAFGADRASIGELVFTTGMVGYIETLTDPSYYGQIVLQTFPLIGNYGIIESDFEGECRLRGYVVREWCDTPSNFRSQYDLDTKTCPAFTALTRARSPRSSASTA